MPVICSGQQKIYGVELLIKSEGQQGQEKILIFYIQGGDERAKGFTFY